MANSVRVHTSDRSIGNTAVSCRIHVPDSGVNDPPSLPGILIIPGFADTATGPHNMHVQLANRLALAGFAVVRFDYRGLGESDGDFRDFTISSGLADAACALDALRGLDQVDERRIGIAGFSLGGAYAAALAAANPDIGTLALLAPIAFPDLVFQTFFKAEHRAQLARDGWMDWLGWPVGAGFMNSLRDLDPLHAFRSAAVSALVIHGTDDQEVSPENAYAYEALGAERKTIEAADHLFSAVRFKERLFPLITDWFLKAVPQAMER